MARPIQPNTPQSRARAQAWLRRATRAAVLAATGLAALIGVVVAREHPGSSSTSSGTGATGAGTSGASTGGTSSNSDDSGTSNTGSTGNTGNTGNSGSSNSPSISNSTPAVTSGGSSR
jgi:negative regulator of sigma E activity